MSTGTAPRASDEGPGSPQPGPTQPSATQPGAVGPRLAVLGQAFWFEAAMRRRSWSRSSHFSVQHLPWDAARALASPRRRPLAALQARWAVPDGSAAQPHGNELSTGYPQHGHSVVDQNASKVGDEGGWALGLVVPKRHARRAVTRNLLRREMRASFLAALPQLPPGAWVMRLTQGFDRSRFPSAASPALRAAAREALAPLWARPAGPQRQAPQAPQAAARGRKPEPAA